MRKLSRWVFGLCAAAQLGSVALAEVCAGDALLGASVNLAIESDTLSSMLTGCQAHKSVSWDAQRLAQSASRFPLLLTNGIDQFALERKFQRTSLLFLDVRDKLVDSLYVSFDDEVAAQMERVEIAYLDMALALAGDGSIDPGGPIDDFSRR
jgi:hypothetical protein